MPYISCMNFPGTPSNINRNQVEVNLWWQSIYFNCGLMHVDSKNVVEIAHIIKRSITQSFTGQLKEEIRQLEEPEEMFTGQLKEEIRQLEEEMCFNVSLSTFVRIYTLLQASHVAVTC